MNQMTEGSLLNW